MSLTVADCLKLPSLQDAKVIAGQNGLGKIVSSVSVLEYARVFAMADALFLGNELIITAFTSVMDDVDAQCNAIRRLNEVGEAAVILYYVGYYVKTVDPRLIAVADELDFPLIIMPPNTYNLRFWSSCLKSESRRNDLSRFFWNRYPLCRSASATPPVSFAF